MSNSQIEASSKEFHFTNRKPEIAIVKDKLSESRQGKPLRLPILHFWGAAGLGKTTLLQKISAMSHDEDPHPGWRKVITALVNFDRTEMPGLWQIGGLQRGHVVDKLYDQLAEQMQVTPARLERSTHDKMAEQLVRCLIGWLPQVTPVLLFDSIDMIPDEEYGDFTWIKEKLIEPLITGSFGQILFVFASRAQRLEWRSYELAKRTETRRLDPFDLTAIQRQVQASASAANYLLENVYGHPLATALLAGEIERKGVDLNAADFAPDDGEGARRAVEQAVERILKDVPNRLKRWASLLSLLRWVDVDPLRAVAEHLNLVKHGLGDGYYLELIDDIRRHHLLFFSSEVGAYRYDSSIRKLIAHDLEYENPELFRDTHQAAFLFHQDHLDKLPSFVVRYLPELAFHAGTLDRLESLGKNKSSFKDWWKRCGKKSLDHPEEWLELIEHWRADLELKEVLSSTDYDLVLHARVK